MIRGRWGRLLATAFFVAAATGPTTMIGQQETAEAEADPVAPLVEAAAWLAGCWEASSPDGQNAAEEQWMAPRGGMMVGMSRSVRGGEAQGYELLTIRVRDGGLVYHAVPSGQTPTDFPARSIEEDRLEFVNGEHDFPQKIIYARMDEDFIEVAVFAEADAAEPAFVLPYRRVRCPGRQDGAQLGMPVTRRVIPRPMRAGSARVMPAVDELESGRSNVGTGIRR